MSKFKKGDKVISVMNTPYAQEGFTGTVAYINSDTRYPINVVKDDQHNSNVYAFADNELALLRTFQADEKESDAVHSPKHYAVFDDIEAIEVIARSMTQEMFKGYCFGNLLKYRLRVGGKDEVMQELGKADKYKELYEKFKGLCQ